MNQYSRHKSPFDVRKLQNIETSRKQQIRNLQKIKADEEAKQEEKRIKKLIAKSGVQNVQLKKFMHLSDELLDDKITQI